MAKTIPFNLNDNIKVKLTEIGYQHLADMHNELVGIIPNWIMVDSSFYKNMADKDGYTTFQAWEFIYKFGNKTGNGYPQYYLLDVLLEVEE